MNSKLCALILLFSFSLAAHSKSNLTATTQAVNPVDIHEIKAMLAFGIIDVFLTGAATGVFYYSQGRTLCSFGKSQVIPLVNGAGLVISAAGARATGEASWIRAAGIFSSTQGVINVFRAYLGIWYHFICGQPLPLMPEHHEFLVMLENQIIEFNLHTFLNPSHHLEVTLEVFENLGLKTALGFLATPMVIFACGLVTLGIGLHASIAA